MGVNWPQFTPDVQRASGPSSKIARARPTRTKRARAHADPHHFSSLAAPMKCRERDTNHECNCAKLSSAPNRSPMVITAIISRNRALGLCGPFSLRRRVPLASMSCRLEGAGKQRNVVRNFVSLGQTSLAPHPTRARPEQWKVRCEFNLSLCLRRNKRRPIGPGERFHC